MNRGLSLYLLVLLLFMGCSGPTWQVEPECVSKLRDASGLTRSSYLQVVAEDRFNEFSVGSNVVFTIKNLSDETIVLPTTGHIAIFDVETCAEVKDWTRREFASPWILKPNSFEAMAIESVLPRFAQDVDTVSLIIYVSGFIDSEEGEEVIAFLRVTLD